MPFPKFKTQAEIPEAFRSEYEEQGGEWVPKPEPNDDAEQLKATLKKERDRADAAETAKKATAAELEKLKTKQKAENAGLTEEQLNKLRADVRAEMDAEYGPTKKTAEDLKAENRALKLDSAVKALAAKHGVRADRIEQWWTQFGPRFELTDDGKPMVKASPGTTVDKYITDTLKAELPDFYQGTQASGGGAAGAKVPGVTGAAPTAFDDVLRNPAAALEQARMSGAAK